MPFKALKATRGNLEALQESMADVTDAWDAMAAEAEVWLDEDSPREERSEAREIINENLDTLGHALLAAAQLFRKGS